MQDIQVAIELGVDLMKDIVAAGYSFLKEKNKERDFFGAATRRYIKNLLDDYGSVRVLGMEDEVQLDSLYVRANIIPKITSRSGILPEEMEQERERYLTAFGRAVETVDGEEIVNREQKFIVLGKPGAGKTTYLKYLTLRMISKDKKSRIQQRKLPIFITLREWADKKVPLLDFIVDQFDLCGFEEARPFVERMLTNGDCLVLLDGLDEVSRDTRLDDIIQQVIDFTRKYRDCQFIASCRVAAYNHWFEKFKDVEIADFNEKQIEQFVRNFFQKEPKTAEECWRKLKNSQSLKEMASVPLLLTLICLSYNPEKRDFLKKRSSLYRETTKLLLEKWDEKRPGGRVKRDEIYKNLSRQNKEAMFARIAWGTFTENQYFIEEELLGRMIQNFIKNLPEYQDEKALPDGERILKQIEAQHGILVERAKGVYSFAHLTFQEYFTAKYIVDNTGEGMLESLINAHLYDRRWKQVFLMVTEMLGNADVFLLLIQEKNQNLKSDVNVDRLTYLANHVITASDHYFWKALTRIDAMNILLQPKEGKAISSDELPKAMESYRKMTDEERKALEQEILEESELVQITYNISIALEEYLQDISSIETVYGNITPASPELIINLKSSFSLQGSLDGLFLFLQTIEFMTNILKSATYVSEPIREKILNEMLMPGKEGE
jgi:hypothetical protein